MLIQEPVTVLLRTLPLVVLGPPSDAASPGTRAEWFGVPQLALAGLCHHLKHIRQINCEAATG